MRRDNPNNYKIPHELNKEWHWTAFAILAIFWVERGRKYVRLLWCQGEVGGRPGSLRFPCHSVPTIESSPISKENASMPGSCQLIFTQDTTQCVTLVNTMTFNSVSFIFTRPIIPATHRQIPLDLQSFAQFTTACPGQPYHRHTGWRER